MNLSQLQSECGRLLNDPSNQRWSTDVLTTRINLAQTEIQGYTNAVKTLEAITPILDVSAIMVDADTMDIIRVTKTLPSGEIKPLTGITREELDFIYPNWQQWQHGEPLFFWWDATNLQINLVPAPNSLYVITSSIFIWESRKPADLVNPTDIPFDGTTSMIPYHIAICYWTVAECWMDNGDPESLAKSKFFKSGNMLNPGQYEMEIGRILAEFDDPIAVPSRVLWQPQGGRVRTWNFPSKAEPLTF